METPTKIDQTQNAVAAQDALERSRNALLLALGAARNAVAPCVPMLGQLGDALKEVWGQDEARILDPLLSHRATNATPLDVLSALDAKIHEAYLLSESLLAALGEGDFLHGAPECPSCRLPANTDRT